MKNSQKDSMIGVKLGSIALLVAIVLSYSLYLKNGIENKLASNGELVLKDMPKFNLPELGKENRVSNDDILSDQRLVFVHFWATWCAPCEAELPSFINFVRENSNKGVRALLVGVQDEEEKMKKYLKRYGDLSDAFVILNDLKGESMAKFGTVKLPETYLFSSDGKNLNKYVGPQDWSLSRYKKRLNFYISTSTTDAKTTKKSLIETH